VVILRVSYSQHRYHPDNVLEDRALSVLRQEVVHPHTGLVLEDMDILGLNQDRLLMLNDIVRGEFHGSILYHGRQRLEYTSGMVSRMKFLVAWLEKHRHILADYSPDNFTRAMKVIYSFLEDGEGKEGFQRHRDLHREVRQVVNRLRISHRLRLLEKLVQSRSDASGRKLQHIQILIILVHVLSQEGESLAQEHPEALRKLVRICQKALDNPYLKRRYLTSPPKNAQQRHIVGEYKLLQALVKRMSAPE
jgi:hypothetical protein